METKYIRRTDDEWLNIINECRTSGCSDKLWCQEHNITLSTFYYQIRRLRKKACCIPKPVNSSVNIQLYNSISRNKMLRFRHRRFEQQKRKPLSESHSVAFK